MKIFTISIFVFLTIAVKGQTLTLDELLNLQESDFVAANDMLLAKGWDFSHSTKGELGNYNIITWAFAKNDFNQATGWLTMYSDENSENILTYQMHSSKIYNAIKSKITAYKMRSISNTIEDNEISSIYQGTKYTVTVSVKSTEENLNPHYIIGVMSNKTYKLIKVNEFLENLDQSEQDENTELGNKAYDGEYLYKSKTISYAPIYKDIELTEKIYMVPPNHYVYVLSELSNNKVTVLCNDKFGYMEKSMLNR